MRTEGRYRRSPAVLARSVGEKVILAPPDRDGFELLDGPAVIIWDLLEEAVTPDEITTMLTARFEGSRDVIARDVEGLVADLSERDLIEEVDEGRG